jgi:hypothetical protein
MLSPTGALIFIASCYVLSIELLMSICFLLSMISLSSSSVLRDEGSHELEGIQSLLQQSF